MALILVRTKLYISVYYHLSQSDYGMTSCKPLTQEIDSVSNIISLDVVFIFITLGMIDNLSINYILFLGFCSLKKMEPLQDYFSVRL